MPQDEEKKLRLRLSLLSHLRASVEGATKENMFSHPLVAQTGEPVEEYSTRFQLFIPRHVAGMVTLKREYKAGDERTYTLTLDTMPSLAASARPDEEEKLAQETQVSRKKLFEAFTELSNDIMAEAGKHIANAGASVTSDDAKAEFTYSRAGHNVYADAIIALHERATEQYRAMMDAKATGTGPGAVAS